MLVLRAGVGWWACVSTGIPLERLGQSDRNRLLSLGEQLHKRVVGQHEAVTGIANAILRSRAGVSRCGAPASSESTSARLLPCCRRVLAFSAGRLARGPCVPACLPVCLLALLRAGFQGMLVSVRASVSAAPAAPAAAMSAPVLK